MNPIKVKEGQDVIDQNTEREENRKQLNNVEKETDGKKNEASKEMGKKVRTPMTEENKQENMLKNEGHDARKKRIRFENNLYNLAITTIHKLE